MMETSSGLSRLVLIRGTYNLRRPGGKHQLYGSNRLANDSCTCIRLCTSKYEKCLFDPGRRKLSGQWKARLHGETAVNLS